MNNFYISKNYNFNMKYLINSIRDSFEILKLNKRVLNRVTSERSLEEIYLSNLFLNYLFALIVFSIFVFVGDIKINGRELNSVVFLGLLLIYPFFFNTFVYVLYLLFGLSAEIINRKKHIEPLIHIGFHSSLIYSIFMFIIFFLAVIKGFFGLFILDLVIIYFLYSMFFIIKETYDFSNQKTLISLLIPIFTIGVILSIFVLFNPLIFDNMIIFLFG